jgi:hypothetical protein
MSTTPTIDRARLLAFLDGGEAGACAAVDWLQDQGADLPDLLGLYAGRPAGDAFRDYLSERFHEDEGLRLVLAKWCQVAEPGRPARAGPTARWEAVRNRGPDLEEEVRRYAWGYSGLSTWFLPEPDPFAPGLQVFRALVGECIRGEGGDSFRGHVRLAVARARRAQQRAVLALFFDIEMTLRAELRARRIVRHPSGRYPSAEFDRGEYLKAGLRDPGTSERDGVRTRWETALRLVRDEERDVPCVVVQTIPAPALVPPEHVEDDRREVW